MTSHGWLLLTLFLPLPLSAGLLFTDTRTSDLPSWLLLVIGVVILLRLIALIMVWRRLWRGVLLGFVPQGLQFIVLLADSFGLVLPTPPPNQTVAGLNLGIILCCSVYFVAAYAARSRRA